MSKEIKDREVNDLNKEIIQDIGSGRCDVARCRRCGKVYNVGSRNAADVCEPCSNGRFDIH